MPRARDYFELRTGGSVSYVRYDSVEMLSEIGGIVFDCDGVLIDESTSYDEAIREAVSKIVGMLTGVRIDPSIISTELIYTVRSIGSFNNDWDTTYLLATALTARIASERLAETQSRLDRVRGGKFQQLEEDTVRDEDILVILRDWVGELDIMLGQLEATALPSHEVLTKVMPYQLASISSEVARVLRYPGRFGESLVVTVFDEVYFGSGNIRAVRGFPPFFNYQGRIEEEKLLVSEDTLRSLRDSVGKLGLSTGRGSWETYKTLGSLLDYFEKSACVFIGDIVAANPEDRSRYEKPSPWPLQEASSHLGVNGSILYVGNSMEDLLMWEKTNSLDGRYSFAGVFSGVKRLDMLDLFLERGADLAIPSVNVLPRVLHHLRGG
ncbi:MAG: hypothetical protein QW756_00470 [Nitrososphaerota archaeon]